ncbi:MAG TPA: CPBP family intramembrane glutamic endopeptidase [Chitinophagales bacterium]|nr:CPBP family intramembrane glutamic endopeptidase [Chitinophagales bacterium]
MEPVEFQGDMSAPPEALRCTACNQPLSPQSRFCPGCGSLLQPLAQSISDYSFNGTAKLLVVFYMVQLILCLLVSALDVFNDYRNVFWVEMFLAFWTLVFAFANAKDIVPLYKVTNINLPVLGLCAVGAVLFSIVIGFVVDWFNLEILGKQFSYFQLYKDLKYSRIFFVLSIAVYPAIFEELAFRGVVYNYVNSVSGSFNAIVISSMTFAIIHVSIVSLVWLIPFALVIGYLRYRYNTLWYGMVIHFLFNGVTCLTELGKF